MFGRSEFLRRVGRAVDGALADGEVRRCATFLRGSWPGRPPAGRGASGESDADWVVVLTDRRLLLFTIGSTARPAALVGAFPSDGVQVVDATLRAPVPAVVLRFPNAVLGWFSPLPAWRAETEELVAELRRLSPEDDGATYPEEDGRSRERHLR